MSDQDLQETTRVTGNSLKTVPHTAADRDNLVGRPSKSLKRQLSHDSQLEVEVKRNNSSTKETQAYLDSNISVNNIINPEGPPEKYWEILAENHQVTLQEVLDENEKLHKIIEDLKEENAMSNMMLDEVNSFVEVIKKELANTSKDDTGIDVNDVSTADETAEDFEENKTA